MYKESNMETKKSTKKAIEKNNSQITMETCVSKVKLAFRDNCEVGINWGDGTQDYFAVPSGGNTDRHRYSKSGVHTITITGNDIRQVWCQENRLTSLKVIGNDNLGGLYCMNNQLEELDISKCTNLGEVYCIGNPLKRLVMGSKKWPCEVRYRETEVILPSEES